MLSELLEAINRLKEAAQSDLGDEFTNFVNDAFKVLPVAFPWFVPPVFQNPMEFDAWLDGLQSTLEATPPPAA
jgi:hypothetical protein